MNRYLLFITVITMSLATSCSLFEQEEPAGTDKYSYLKEEGLFIVNEGNFMSGNGSISYFSFRTSSLYNNLFEEINGRPLGDIPNSVLLHDTLAFILVNNSGKIEVTNRATFKSVKTIRGLESPRNMLIVSSDKAYVTSLWSEKIAIIDLASLSVSGYIDIRRSSEAIISARNKIYVSCWASGTEIMVIDPLTDELKDSIAVGNEPESMIVDKNSQLWVLCTGGYSGQNYPELVRINTLTDVPEKVYNFQSKTVYPTSLCINKTGDTIYYIENGIRRMSVNDTALPSSYFVPASGRVFYKIATGNGNGRLFATNAMDYQQKGYFISINSRGEVTDSARAGIIPAFMCYNTVN